MAKKRTNPENHQTKVLMVDDEVPFLFAAKKIIEDLGDLSVETATGGHEGLALLKKTRYDAVISDYRMPEMNGGEFLKKVRIRYPAMPFVMYAARGQEDVVIHALRNGADYYALKEGNPKRELADLAGHIRQLVAKAHLGDALRKSEERYRFIIEHFHGIAFRRTPEGDIVFLNGAVEEITGYTEQDLAGMAWDQVVWYEDRPELHRMISDAREKGEVRLESEYRILTKDGELRWVHEYATLLMTRSGKIEGVQGTLHDINGQHIMEEQVLIQRDLALGLAASRSLEMALPLCLEAVCGVAGADMGILYLIDPYAKELNAACSLGLDDGMVQRVASWETHTELLKNIRRNRAFYGDYTGLTEFTRRTGPMPELLGTALVPIIDREKAIGCIFLSSQKVQHFSDVNILGIDGIAYQVGSAIARIWVEEMLKGLE